jgi:hypothetical protein
MRDDHVLLHDPDPFARFGGNQSVALCYGSGSYGYKLHAGWTQPEAFLTRGCRHRAGWKSGESVLVRRSQGKVFGHPADRGPEPAEVCRTAEAES